MENLEATESQLALPSGEEMLDRVLAHGFKVLEGIDLVYLEDIGKGGQAVVVRVASEAGIKGFNTFALKISMGGSFLEKEIYKSLEFEHENFIHVLAAEAKQGLNILAMEEGIESLSVLIKRISPSPPLIS